MAAVCFLKLTGLIKSTILEDGRLIMLAETIRPSYAGVYPVLDAALYIRATTPLVDKDENVTLRLSTRHLYAWVREGLAGNYLFGLRGNDLALTFLDLITMRMVAIFRSHGIKPSEIKKAHDNLRDARGWPHPFAMEPIWVSGPDIYIQEGPFIVAVSRWQAAFDFIREFLIPVHNIHFDAQKEASSWEPNPGIVLDPQVAFGAPCIKGTRIPTETLWALHEAGDSIELIASAYGLSPRRVRSAIAWEEELEKSAA